MADPFQDGGKSISWSDSDWAWRFLGNLFGHIFGVQGVFKGGFKEGFKDGQHGTSYVTIRCSTRRCQVLVAQWGVIRLGVHVLRCACGCSGPVHRLTQPRNLNHGAIWCDFHLQDAPPARTCRQSPALRPVPQPNTPSLSALPSALLSTLSSALPSALPFCPCFCPSFCAETNLA